MPERMSDPASQSIITPSLYRQRLTLLATVMVGAQGMYLVLVLGLLQSGFKPPAGSASQQPVTLILFVLGLLGTIFSFPAARIAARRSPPPGDFLKMAIALGRQFFVGFAFSETTALAGLAIFFLYGDLQAVIFMLCTAAISIGLHFLRVRRKLDVIIQSQH